MPAAASPNPHLLTPVEDALLALAPAPEGSSAVVQSACAAEATGALTSPLARRLFHLERDPCSHKLSVGVRFPADGWSIDEHEDVLAVAVAALHAYAQVNWTGPSLALSPLELFSPDVVEATGATDAELSDRAIDELALGGEPVYHLSKKTTFAHLALQLLGLVHSPFSPFAASSSSSTPHGPAWALESVKIWRLRAGIMWLRILDEPVPLPGFIQSAAHDLRHVLPARSPARASLSLSLSLLASLLSRSSPHSTAQKEATIFATEAAKEAGLEWELTGRMGKRTKWQIDEKTQLVVLAKDATSGAKKEGKEVDATAAKIPEMLALNDDTLLERTSYADAALPTSSDLAALDPSDQPSISPFSQSVLLSLSLATLPAPTSLMHLSADVLSTSQISAFVDRVLSDPQNWSVHSMALLLRCRAEAGRSRTVERGVLQMQALVDQLKDGSPTEVSAISSAVKAEDMASARDRLAQFHALALPPAWEMERELAVRYMSLGIVKSALEIFTRLEMWEEVARCWMTLERPDRGVDIIRELLEGRKAESDVVMNDRKGDGALRFKGGEKREAKLWCTLGELERKPEHYEKAWEVSGHSSSRAQRSLGAVYFSRNEYDKAGESLRLALAINPLFPRTWFMLGCCEMRLEDWKGAQEAFSRCVGLDGEDAESWSNLASCHLRRGEIEGDKRVDDVDEEDGAALDDEKDEDREAVVKLPFSRKRAAFQCLRQAIKYSYDSWRLWYNYMVVAMDVGELSEACRALDRMVVMRIEKDGEAAVDLEVLEKLVDAVTRADSESTTDAGERAVNPNEGKGLYRPVEHLLTHTILPHVSNSRRVFLAQARLLLWTQDYAGALDAHLKAYRAAVVNNPDVAHDRTAFREAVEQVETVVSMMENLGPKDGKDGAPVAKDWKFQARSLVRTFLGRTRESFEDEPEYGRLKELQQELR
ncbi:hypothetical protein JCM10295v2_003590 [Rhodotorula toruloides]